MLNERSRFATALKDVMLKYSIRSRALADYLNVSPQYVSRILTARTLPSRQQTGTLHTFLEKFGVSDEERRTVMEAYIVCRTGFETVLPTGGMYLSDPQEVRLVTGFRNLPPEKKEQILNQLPDESTKEK